MWGLYCNRVQGFDQIQFNKDVSFQLKLLSLAGLIRLSGRCARALPVHCAQPRGTCHVAVIDALPPVACRRWCQKCSTFVRIASTEYASQQYARVIVYTIPLQ
jgi:hypothetical protein